MNETLENPLASKAFGLWCKGCSFASIARQLNIDQRTAAKFVREEAARVHADTRENGDAIFERQVCGYSRIRDRAFALLDSSDPTTIAKGAKAAVDALRGLDRLFGYERPSVVLMPSAPATPLDGLSPLQIMEVLRLLSARKDATMKRALVIDDSELLP